MYWNNPVVKLTWPAIIDPIADSLHNGYHCIFYNPAVDKNQIRVNQSLVDLCNWANHSIGKFGIEQFLSDSRNHDQIANLVKLNMWVDDLPRRGNVKPLLLQYTGRPLYESGTGESRLKALERIDSITTVSAFVCTHRQYRNQFDYLENITNLDRFAEVCGATVGQTFLFRLTDEQALYGLDWYEYDSQATSTITPSEGDCINAITKYFQQNPNTIFTPEWFDKLIDWDLYQEKRPSRGLFVNSN